MLGCVEKAILTGDSTRPRACIGADTHAMCAARETACSVCHKGDCQERQERGVEYICSDAAAVRGLPTLRLSVV